MLLGVSKVLTEKTNMEKRILPDQGMPASGWY